MSESGEASFNFNQTTEGDTYIAFEGIVTQPYALKVDVTSVSLNKNKLSFSGKGENETLIAAILPENATCKTITWTTGNKKVATVDSNGKVTAVGNGTTYIVAKADDNNLMAVCKVTVAYRDRDINITKFAQRLYKSCHGRTSDIKGLDHCKKGLVTGVPKAASVVQGFCNSQSLQML